MTDEHIMQMVRDGQVRQLAILYEKYKKPLLGFFWNCTKNTALSEDLVQGVFERVLKYRTSYKDGQVFKPWLFRIARNLKNTHFTKKREFSDDFKVVETFNDSEKIIDELIIEKEKLQQLHQALDELPEKTKEILVLFKFQRIPYKELANILNCSESAAKVRVHRAIKQLRKAYFKIEYR